MVTQEMFLIAPLSFFPADDIFSASTKPKKKSKKPSFEQLLDDDTDLFVQNKVQQNTSQVSEQTGKHAHT